MSTITPDIFRSLSLNFDGAQPLVPSHVEAWYTVRPNPVAREILAELDRGDRRRIVLFGQPGIGKSTELNVVMKECKTIKFRAGYVPIDKIADVSRLGWEDLSVLCVLWLAYGLIRESTKKKLPPFQSQELTDLLQVIGIPNLQEAGGVFRYHHDKIRTAIATSPQQVMDLCQRILNGMSKFTKRGLVAIVDGTDRMTSRRAEEMLFDKGPQLHEFPCSLVITLPFSIQLQPWFSEVKDHFEYIVRMRAHDPESDMGKAFFTELCQRRLADLTIDELFASTVFNQFIRYGAGVPRQFLHLVSHALRVAEGKAEPPHLDQYCLDRAVEKERESFFYRLSDDTILGRLRDFRLGQSLERESLDELLRSEAVIEYEPFGSSRPPRRINPICEAILQDFERRAPVKP